MKNEREVRSRWVIEVPEGTFRPPTRRRRSSRWLGWIVAVLGALLALALVQLACRDEVRSARAAPSHTADKRIIAVDGTARLDIPPDRAELTITVEEQRTSPRAAG